MLKQKRQDIIFMNDKASYNQLYRSGVAELLTAENFNLINIGLFNCSGNFSIASTVQLIKNITAPCISSNLRSNVVALIQPWRRGLVIINGLGRRRSKTHIRWLLIKLISINISKSIAIQSYADYRYFRRFSKHNKLVWIPGSGGKRKQIGKENAAIIVQRDDKIGLVAKSLEKIINIKKYIFYIVGCRDGIAVKFFFPCDSGVNLGYQNADDIFICGNVFIQPSGYGEGFPHSLADAISSRMKILITKREFLRYGLWRLGGSLENIEGEWCELKYGSELKDATCKSTVDKKYVKAFKMTLTQKGLDQEY